MDEITKIVQMSKDKTYQQEQDQILLEPFTYICRKGSKQNQLKLSRAFNYWIRIEPDKHQLIFEIIQLIHNCSFLFDDIEDNTVIRRGCPAAHSIYGVKRTLNAALFIQRLILEKLLLLEHPDAIKVCCEQMYVLHHGQGMDGHWRDKFMIPSELEYNVMAEHKRGGLFMMCVRLMQLFSTNKADFRKLVAIIGLYFQILDDYSNMSRKNAAKKRFFEDLTEGKFSFPIIHALRNQENREEVLKIVRTKASDDETKTYFIRLLERTGSLKYTKDTLFALLGEAREEMARFGPNPLMEELIHKFHTWVTDTEADITSLLTK